MKKLVFLFCALFVCAPSMAQYDEFEDDGIVEVGAKPKKHAFFLGPKAGVTMTSMSQPNECDLYDGMGIGFSAGLAAKARFCRATESSPAGTGFWGVGMELKYKINNVKTIGTDESGKQNANMSLGYFEVPIYAHVYPFAKSSAMNSFYVELGASIAGVISRSPKSLTVLDANGQYDVVNYLFDAGNSKLKGMDIRPMIGLGYTVPGTGLDVNARYYIGTSELAGNFPCKMNSFEVSLAYMFKLGK